MSTPAGKTVGKGVNLYIKYFKFQLEWKYLDLSSQITYKHYK